MSGSGHNIKIAAYKLSSPKHVSINWTLDALLDIYHPERLSLDNDNLQIYYDQIKSFSPDLIISDLEYFTSYLASLLNVPLWQYSSSLLNYGLLNNNIGLFKYYAHSLNRETEFNQRTLNLIANSNLNLIYSHFGDSSQAPELKNNFQWVRPYHQVGRDSVPCQHYLVAGFSKANVQVVDILKHYSDSVVFMEAGAEKYQNVCVKDIDSEDEYYCNLKNCQYFVCQGQSSFLADAFYNGKFPLIYPDYQDTESIINSHLSKQLGLGQMMHGSENITELTGQREKPCYQDSIKYLHQKIETLRSTPFLM
jgi:uncharacterized protein (TIGR00661 family)